MRATTSFFTTNHFTNPNTFIKTLVASFIFLSIFFAVKHFPSSTTATTTNIAAAVIYSAFNSTVNSSTTSPPKPITLSSPPPSPPPPRLPEDVVARTGIVDDNGAMTDDFVIGDYDSRLLDNAVNESSVERVSESDENWVKIKKFKICDESKREYIPCLDNLLIISKLNASEKWEKCERHCPEIGSELDCLVPNPKGYKDHIPWPKSRDEVWYDNVPHTRLVEDKGGQNWISRNKDKFIFPGGGTQFIHGANQYLDQISKMVPDIAFGQHVRVALDVGCGVASFGAFLLDRNVTTLSIAPKDVHENQIQFALERGVPAMVAVFATRRLLYPSQAFDLIHCSRCRINWTRDDGILLLEVNRMLRAGGYFVWAAQPVYKHDDKLQEQWKEMEDLTGRLCWELVAKEGYIAIWRKSLNNTCYLARNPDVQPPICDADDDPDNVWYVPLKACITRLPENGYGGNVTMWPARLNYPPDRLQSIKMDAFLSRKDIYKAESKYWKDITYSYVNVFRWKKLNVRNVMDMRARYGGFAAGLIDHGVDCWVMNVVPVSDTNTLPVIYDRGLIGVMHDWCEPFDTYPRTYDILNAAGLFSIEQKSRCDISTIMLEMNRILRPNGHVYIRDANSIIYKLEEIAKAMGWITHVFDNGEGPNAGAKLLTCEKRL
ncbi:probable methyltransferase PMT10 [Rutidosis leptorrhynchoides]|uniref:probable methyltransferase PMT10 n=1 Tax=Rutidosis leptorrhynchoides TaxID=125765 RepID=UPI003A995A1A